MRITLIRHGQTAGNRERRYIGITDETLCGEGRKAIAEAVRANAYPAADLVFSSPMRRCRETAEWIYPEAELRIIDDFRETDFGAFEGKNYSELRDNPDYQRWIDSGGALPFPGGESREEASARMWKGFTEMLSAAEAVSGARACVPRKTGNEERRSIENTGGIFAITAVVHGGTIMAVLERLFGGNYYDYYVKNGEGYTFDRLCDGSFQDLRNLSPEVRLDI